MRSIRAVLLAFAVAALGGCGTGEDANGPFRADLRRTEVDGTKISWYARGDGEPLVMLMGTGSTMAEWDPALLRLLSREHRLILFDYPGVGLSGKWRGNSFDSLADYTAGLIETVGIDRATVLGWSMGGFVAQRLAIRHPELVSGLVLAGTNPGSPRTTLGTPEAQEIDSDPDPSDAQILHELYPPDRQAEGRRFLDRLATASRSGEIPDDFAVPSKTTDAQVAAEDPWLRSGRNLRQLARIEVPVLAAAGRDDPVVPPKNLRLIAERIDDARLEVFPGAHAFLFQDRERFTGAVGAVTGTG